MGKGEFSISIKNEGHANGTYFYPLILTVSLIFLFLRRVLNVPPHNVALGKRDISPNNNSPLRLKGWDFVGKEEADFDFHKLNLNSAYLCA